MPTVFYAWQSDQRTDVCRYLIRDAANAALKKLKREPDIFNAPSFELDQDRQGVPGHPHIASVIRRKIKACDVFLADLTFVAAYVTHDKRMKGALNPNVLIELGIAIRAKGFERLLLVMNSAFGEPDDLPFDLKSHSFPITYDLPDASDPQRLKEVRAKLSDDIATSLKPMLAAAADERARAEELQGQSWTDEQWRIFENQVLNEGFRGTQKGRPYFACAVIPLKKPSQPLDLRNEELRVRAKPIPGGPFNSDTYGRSIVNSNSKRGTGGRRAEPPTWATEVTDTGSVFAVADLIPGRWSNDEQYRCIPLQDDERDWITAVDRYVLLLRDMKVANRFAVRMMLTDCHNMIMLPRNHRDYDARVFRGLPNNVFYFEPVTVKAGGVIAALRPLFEILWREAGLSGDPSFDRNGDWR